MPTINQAINPVRGTAVNPVAVWADFTGAGAGAPTVSASTVLPKQHNYAQTREGNTTTITRNAAGDYTFVFPTAPSVVLDVQARARGATALQCNVQTWSITSGRLTVQVKCYTPAGVATDLANGTDWLRVRIEGDLSNSYS